MEDFKSIQKVYDYHLDRITVAVDKGSIPTAHAVLSCRPLVLYYILEIHIELRARVLELMEIDWQEYKNWSLDEAISLQEVAMRIAESAESLNRL